MSADGSMLAVGAGGESSASTGVGGNELDDSALRAGAVYLFARDATTWIQDNYVKASNTGAGDEFGGSVALSADGVTLAVAAQREDSADTGIAGDQSNNAATDSGAVYVFR